MGWRSNFSIFPMQIARPSSTTSPAKSKDSPTEIHAAFLALPTGLNGLFQREEHGESCPFWRTAFQIYQTAVAHHDFLHQGKPQAAARRLGGEKGDKNLVAI